MQRATFAVFADLDGMQLAEDAFALRAARTIVRRLRSAAVPVVPITSLTLEEITPLADELGLGPAVIIESGGGICRRAPGGWDVEGCGLDADEMLDVMREIEDRSDADLIVCPPGEKERVARRFNDPFTVERGDPARVAAVAAELGFVIRAGHRYLHLFRRSEEGEAFRRLRDELAADVVIAFGSAPLDACSWRERTSRSSCLRAAAPIPTCWLAFRARASPPPLAPPAGPRRCAHSGRSSPHRGGTPRATGGRATRPRSHGSRDDRIED